jgi:hypothetical protein
MSRKVCAEFLGVSLRTVRYWDAGRSRVPWSVVRLLRLTRLGDLGAMHDSWAGWIVNRKGLWSPDGKHYPEPFMRRWWLTCEQARFFREAYDRDTLGGVGAQPLRARERVTLLPEARMAGKQADAASVIPIGARSTPTAFAHDVGKAAGAAGVGMAVGLFPVAARLGHAAAARSDAGLVNLSTSGTRFALSRMAQGFRRVHGR